MFMMYLDKVATSDFMMKVEDATCQFPTKLDQWFD
jgi:hypothetical protein